MLESESSARVLQLQLTSGLHGYSVSKRKIQGLRQYSQHPACPGRNNLHFALENEGWKNVPVFSPSDLVPKKKARQFRRLKTCGVLQNGSANVTTKRNTKQVSGSKKFCAAWNWRLTLGTSLASRLAMAVDRQRRFGQIVCFWCFTQIFTQIYALHIERPQFCFQNRWNQATRNQEVVTCLGCAQREQHTGTTCRHAFVCVCVWHICRNVRHPFHVFSYRCQTKFSGQTSDLRSFNTTTSHHITHITHTSHHSHHLHLTSHVTSCKNSVKQFTKFEKLQLFNTWPVVQFNDTVGKIWVKNLYNALILWVRDSRLLFRHFMHFSSPWCRASCCRKIKVWLGFPSCCWHLTTPQMVEH